MHTTRYTVEVKGSKGWEIVHEGSVESIARAAWRAGRDEFPEGSRLTAESLTVAPEIEPESLDAHRFGRTSGGHR